MSEDFAFSADADAFVCVCGRRYLANVKGAPTGKLAFEYVDWFRPNAVAFLECPCGASLEARHQYLLEQWETV